MAWPVDTGTENDSPESVEANVSSSTDGLNGPPNGLQNMYGQGAAGSILSRERQHLSMLSNAPNLHDMIQFSVPNPQVDRIRNSRRFSTGDINLTNGQQPSANRPDEINIAQRHSVPCCHINPNVLHSCCLQLNRQMSLSSSDLRRRNSVPQNYNHGHYNADSEYLHSETQAVSMFRVNSEYERRCPFRFSHSFLFGNENLQPDWIMQQTVCSLGPEFFLTFLADVMNQRGLQFPENMFIDISQNGDIPLPLMYLMDRFSASLEREMLFRLSQRVQLPLNLNSFIAIIDGINKGTTGPEKQVVLFFFCADLAIRAFCEGNASLFSEIVSWTQWYLRRSRSLVSVPSIRSTCKITLTVCIVGMIAALFLVKRN